MIRGQRDTWGGVGTALFPAALGLLSPMILLAGRLSWLVPLLVLPVVLGLRPVWRRLGEDGLARGLKTAFGKTGGTFVGMLYYLWGLLLLQDAGRGYLARLATVTAGEGGRWLFLMFAVGLSLWLSRGDGSIFRRTGHIFFLLLATVLVVTLLLALPGVSWKNLIPITGENWRGVPGGGVLFLSLSGYGVFVLCTPLGNRNRMDGKRVAVFCGILAGILYIIVGTFGVPLSGELREPFLDLLEGVQVPGAFHRGEAGLVALLILGDLMLLALLLRGCGVLWQEMVTPLPMLGWVLAVLATGTCCLEMAEKTRAWLNAVLPRGNLCFGILLPVLVALTEKGRKWSIIKEKTGE